MTRTVIAGSVRFGAAGTVLMRGDRELARLSADASVSDLRAALYARFGVGARIEWPGRVVVPVSESAASARVEAM